jgi:two-component system, NtrC family, sensor histidine kinase KinB
MEEADGTVMAIKSLHTRFLLSGCLIVLTTVACSVLAAWTLYRMSRGIHEALLDSQRTIEALATLTRALEREDDAVLLAVSGRFVAAREELGRQRAEFDRALESLQPHLTEPSERALVARFARDVAALRQLGDRIVSANTTVGLFDLYHDRVNPTLRQAVATATELREMQFRAMTQAGMEVEGQARWAMWVVAGIAVGALLLSSCIAVVLTRRVVGPVSLLTQAAEALGAGDFERRVDIRSPDELGRLAAGFNRMATALAEIQRLNVAQVLEAKGMLEATLEAIPDAVLLFDTQEQVISANQAARTVLGLQDQDTLTPLVQLPVSQTCAQAVREALAGRHPPAPNADLRDAFPLAVNGTQVKLLPVVIPVPSFVEQGHGAVLVLYDVTAFAKLDELRMELIAVASHELKTPLTPLTMTLLMLREEGAALPERQRLMLASALEAVDELSKTIDELLDLTRVDAGQLRLTIERLDLCRLVDEAVRQCGARFEESGVRLEVRKEVSSAFCQGDAVRLLLVLNNILANALKYSPAGGVVRVEMSRQNTVSGARSVLHCAVTDAGPGVPAEFRERVFEKFFRVEHHRRMDAKERKGTGIGLYLCKHIITAHGGHIWCDAGEHGVGTCIAIILPGES